MIYSPSFSSIRYTSGNSHWRLSTCSSTKKLIATVKYPSAKGSGSSILQTTFLTSLPGCCARRSLAMSQAVYDHILIPSKKRYNLPSHAQRSTTFFVLRSLGKKRKNTPFSKLSKCLWCSLYCLANLLYQSATSKDAICFLSYAMCFF